MYKMEKLYRLFRYTTTKRVAFTVFVFQGATEHWWRSTEPILKARHAEVTWEIFLDAFRRQYVPATAQRKLRMEFLSLVHGN